MVELAQSVVEWEVQNIYLIIDVSKLLFDILSGTSSEGRKGGTWGDIRLARTLLMLFGETNEMFFPNAWNFSILRIR